MQEKLTREAVKSAMVQPVKGEHVVTESATVRTLDLATMTVADTEFSSEEVTLRARRDGVRGDEDDDAVKAGAGEGATGLTQRSVIVEDDGAGPVMCHGIVLWFDTEFSARFCEEAPVTLSTSPHERQTHWAQTMLHFPEPVALAPEGFARVEGATTGAVGTVGNPASAVRVRVGMAKCAEEIRARAPTSRWYTPPATARRARDEPKSIACDGIFTSIIPTTRRRRDDDATTTYTARVFSRSPLSRFRSWFGP